MDRVVIGPLKVADVLAVLHKQAPAGPPPAVLLILWIADVQPFPEEGARH